MSTSATSPPAVAPRQQAPFTFRQRLALSLISWFGRAAVRAIGPTLRFQLHVEEGGPEMDPMTCGVWVFWHRCVFPATWYFRDRNIAVMTSSSFDGEYIARIIERFGFRAVRGSSTRGGVRALLGMHREIEAGRVAAFTIDGPQGPAFVAKPGPVLLARNVGRPIVPFYVAVRKPWVLNTWDKFMVPRPFSRAVVYVGRMILVPADAGTEALDQYHAAMQRSLERVRDAAEQFVNRA